MLTAYGSAEAGALKRKARSIELQAARSSPTLAAQLLSLAEQYYAEAETRDITVPRHLAGVALRHGLTGHAAVARVSGIARNTSKVAAAPIEARLAKAT
jgi:hypothetical protein